MADALARRHYNGFTFISRGVAAMDGDTASPMAVNVMHDIYNIDITGHVSRLVTEEDVRNAALILTMTNSHKQRIAFLFPFACDKLYTLYGLACADGDMKDYDIADPFMGSFEVYADCAAEIKRCLDLIDFSKCI